MTFYHCGKVEHIRKHCRFLKREKSKEGDEDKEKKNDKDTIAFAYDSDVFIVCDDSSLNIAISILVGLLISNPYIMTLRRNFFSF